MRQLEAFCRVVETGSFSRAAKALGLSQPTASEHVKSLEAELETRLFDRLGRRVQPTRAGLLLHGYARKILATRDEARLAVEEYLGIVRGHLSLGASTIPGGYLLPCYLGRFKKDYPDTTIHLEILDSQRVIDGVLNGDFQVGVVGARRPDGHLESRFFAADELVLAVSPRHPLARRRSVRAAELAGVEMIVREEGSGTRSVAEARLRELGFEARPEQVAAVLGDAQAVRSAIKADVGVAIVSRVAVEEDFASGALRAVEIQGFDCQREFYSVVHKARSLTPLAARFLRFLHEEGP